MSSGLIIFINEHEKFDFSSTVRAISNLDNVYNLIIQTEYLMEDVSKGSVLFCEFRYDDDMAIVHLGNYLDFISTDSLGKAGLYFALKLQSVIDIPLTAVDTGYNFQVKLDKINSIQEFLDIRSSGIYME